MWTYTLLLYQMLFNLIQYFLHEIVKGSYNSFFFPFKRRHPYPTTHSLAIEFYCQRHGWRLNPWPLVYKNNTFPLGHHASSHFVLPKMTMKLTNIAPYQNKIFCSEISLPSFLSFNENRTFWHSSGPSRTSMDINQTYVRAL